MIIDNNEVISDLHVANLCIVFRQLLKGTFLTPTQAVELMATITEHTMEERKEGQ